MTDQTTARTVRLPLKVTSLASAACLVAWLDDPEPPTAGVSYQQAADSPTQFTLVGQPPDLMELLFFVAANQLVTDRSAFVAAMTLLERVTRS